MQIIIDRFEGDYAIVEICAGKYANLPRALVPADAQEGDILQITKAETNRAEKIETLMNNLFEA